LGLSAKLLLLTIAFVMLAEVLIFVPSVANYRVVWLLDRISAARIAALAADANRGGTIPANVKRELLENAKVLSISIKLNNARRMVLQAEEQSVIARHYDLRPPSQSSLTGSLSRRFGLIADALGVFLAPKNRIIRVQGHPMSSDNGMFGPGDFVEITLPEEPLRAAMVGYAVNILLLSIVISIITAALIYFALVRLLVRPMRALSTSMLHFAEQPEDPGRIIEASTRGDEIGTAERELQQLQKDLQQMLKQKDHLAQLGLAVSKINHDLRNMLASAQLMSDRLTSVDDPTVQRFSPKLIASLDRAINFCDATLRYGRAEEASPRREMLVLADLVGEVGDGLGLPRDGMTWEVSIEPNILVDGDRDQLHRVLNNLVRNAVQALESMPPPSPRRISVRGSRESGWTRIWISDTGPGVPEQARARLFQPFKGGVRRGGTGLGLTIAAELVKAHRGRLTLVDAAERIVAGAEFLIEIPDRSVATPTAAETNCS
jgi:signal transduction histidine kinase